MEPSPTPAACFHRSQIEVSTRSAGDRKSPKLELLREPLVLFFAAGALLFGLDRAVDSRRGDAEIRVPAPVRAAAAAKLEASLGRAASDDEVRSALETWIREEAVYREGLRRGLDKFDPVIRERVVHKTLVVSLTGLMEPPVIGSNGASSGLRSGHFGRRILPCFG